jgi:hypothetical protein
MLMRSWNNNIPPATIFAPLPSPANWVDAPPELHVAAHLETGLDLGLPYLPDVHVRPYFSIDVTGMEGIGWLGWRSGLTLAWRFGAPHVVESATEPVTPSRPPLPL